MEDWIEECVDIGDPLQGSVGDFPSRRDGDE
eukprot:CAMPEP_0181500558 /NCGR_PEP_ID=MMETSP1110-20121109/55289_1 /TAXON_ID=174948 /ORGANISM="Symbiodinium sp., Strain CCMP421" /LENGTH=30 /DNA_ID= /DNA_START= /DNA_END= /DNA_ORIENTATION=